MIALTSIPNNHNYPNLTITDKLITALALATTIFTWWYWPYMITFNPTISNIYHDSPLCIYYLPDFYVKFLSFSDPAQRQDPCTQIQHKDGTPGQCLVTYTEFSVALLLFRCRPKNGSYACLLIETTHCYSNQGLGCY